MKLKKVSLKQYVDMRSERTVAPLFEYSQTQMLALQKQMQDSLLKIEAKLQELEEEEEEAVVEETHSDNSAIDELRDEIKKLKSRKPENQFVGGSGATGSYHAVTTDSMRFSKHSFNPGINIIGVRSGVPTTIYLPSNLEPNHIVSVKDELGVSGTHPITVLVSN